MVDFIKKNLFFGLALIFYLVFFSKLIFGLLPIPADTIVSLYYPFRDNFAKEYPRGIPFKNFLITDPVRQLYPWKSLVIEAEKKVSLPLWNPYSFSGTPLLANFQSASFYPLNLVFLIVPFHISWTIYILAGPVFAGIFMFAYLNNLKLKREASILGSLIFAFSGFSVAWMEWGNVLNVALWLPLILLSIDKLFKSNKAPSVAASKWAWIYLISLCCSFFAGHLQVFFYVFLLESLYIVFRWFENKRRMRSVLTFATLNVFFIILTFIQWYPTLQFILLSARGVDVVGYKAEGWFIPWQNLVQFIVPDFFGNPTTLNYTGIWNYAEFIGYIGIAPLIFALYSIFFRRDKNSLFFTFIALLCFAMALPSPISKIPFILHIPFIETAQPTRLIFLIDFSLAVLVGMGYDFYSRQKKGIIYLFMLSSVIFIGIWVFVLFGSFGIMYQEDLVVARKNLFLPTALFMSVFVVFFIARLFHNLKSNMFDKAIFIVLFLIISFDLIRFGWKFEAFTKKEYLFPESPVISYLKRQSGQFRVMSAASEIFPPNFSAFYRIQTTDGYDPLYLMRYAELSAAYSRNKPDISVPFGFNRIITLQDPKSRLADLFGVRYVLSATEIKSDKLSPVFSDGMIKVFENNSAFPRAFFVSTVYKARGKQDAMNAMFDSNNLLNHVAIVEDAGVDFKKSYDTGKINISDYSENYIKLKTENQGEGFMVLTDTYYPAWHAKIDGKEAKIYLTDYTFRGLLIPKGNHEIEFYATLF